MVSWRCSTSRIRPHASTRSCEAEELRAARANRGFRTDNTRHSVRGLYKIADCVRTDFRPYAIGDPRGRAAVRASSSTTDRGILPRPPTSANGHCALRAPTVFSVRIRSASVQKTRLWIKARTAWGCFYPRSQPCKRGDQAASRKSRTIAIWSACISVGAWPTSAISTVLARGPRPAIFARVSRVSTSDSAPRSTSVGHLIAS